MIRSWRNLLGLALPLAVMGWSARAAEVPGSPSAQPPVTFLVRVFYDVGTDNSDRRQLNSDQRFASLRFGVAGKMAPDTRYAVQFELQNWLRDSGSYPHLRIAQISHNFGNGISLDAGQIYEPFCLEATTAERNSTFLQRALSFAFVPLYHLGAAASVQRERWGAAAGVFGPTAGQENHDEGYGASARAFFSPIRKAETALHIGGAIGRRMPDGDVARFSARPETVVTEARLVDTGLIDGVDAYTSLGAEAAFTHGPVSVQAEYIGIAADRAQKQGLNFDSWYVYGTFFLTGEHRAFDSGRGVFRDIHPKSKGGAVELALRLSEVDMDDRDVRGGKQRDVTLGVNWYMTSKLRLMLNHIRVQSKRRGISDDPNLTVVRLQFEL